MKYYYRYHVVIKSSLYGGTHIYYYDHPVRIHDYNSKQILDVWEVVQAKNYPLYSDTGMGRKQYMDLANWPVYEYHLLKVESVVISDCKLRLDE